MSLQSRLSQTVYSGRLLSISGEDTLSVDRKYLSFWTGKLTARLTILTNELPAIADPSGALAGRFLTLKLENSFYGKEDTNLSEALLEELPGILLWALDGLDRLRERGHFNQPPSALDVIQQLEDLGSPLRAFIRQQCELGAGRSVGIERFFEVWTKWCDATGHEHGTTQSVGRELRTVVPGLRVRQPRENRLRVRRYYGIRLKPDTQ